jgi:tRNA threonylcarbamoyladenosine biosynthesis protein TsaB
MTKLPTMLAIETATSACSVALSVGQKTVSRYAQGNNIHSQVVLEMVAEVLAETDTSAKNLQAIAVGQGPGSFTGLRIGIGVAQGLAYAANCPLVGVPSLEALAWRAVTRLNLTEKATIIAGLDARMSEIYWAEYQYCEHNLRLQGEIVVCAPNLIVSTAEVPILVGNAWSEYEDQLDETLRLKGRWEDQLEFPHAEEVLELGQKRFSEEGGVPAAEFEADYVRNNVAKKSAKSIIHQLS